MGSYLQHELLYKLRIVPAVQHSNVQELRHVQEPIIVQECCLLLLTRSSRLYCHPDAMQKTFADH